MFLNLKANYQKEENTILLSIVKCQKIKLRVLYLYVFFYLFSCRQQIYSVLQKNVYGPVIISSSIIQSSLRAKCIIYSLRK